MSRASSPAPCRKVVDQRPRLCPQSGQLLFSLVFFHPKKRTDQKEISLGGLHLANIAKHVKQHMMAK